MCYWNFSSLLFSCEGVFEVYTSELRARQEQLEKKEEEVRQLKAKLREMGL